MGNAPKQPLSAYFIFSSEERLKVKNEHPSYSICEVAKELGRRWADMAPYRQGNYANTGGAVTATTTSSSVTTAATATTTAAAASSSPVVAATSQASPPTTSAVASQPAASQAQGSSSYSGIGNDYTSLLQ